MVDTGRNMAPFKYIINKIGGKENANSGGFQNSYSNRTVYVCYFNFSKLIYAIVAHFLYTL